MKVKAGYREIMVQVREDLFERIEAVCEKRDIPRSIVVREALDQYLPKEASA